MTRPVRLDVVHVNIDDSSCGPRRPDRARRDACGRLGSSRSRRASCARGPITPALTPPAGRSALITRWRCRDGYRSGGVIPATPARTDTAAKGQRAHRRQRPRASPAVARAGRCLTPAGRLPAACDWARMLGQCLRRRLVGLRRPLTFEAAENSVRRTNRPKPGLGGRSRSARRAGRRFSH